ncbi:ECF-type sigma factor [Tahibacter amnicola]|uniref:ECF-type sigma factor n=1 Tax=Tahibacter amnicola TaxID=2976241 RepID=A0ABY6BDC1_9GAMM|nr:ECF-type sigma factor [Tahibacter amnicola]UXI67749.1 ECF-type sigma factor [Tahibacter amnicola]
MESEVNDITSLLHEWQHGSDTARDQVFDRMYAELRRLARGVMRSHRDHDTLQPTALLNDALLKLLDAVPKELENRGHFVGIVATKMRQILIDRARARLCDKRGGGARPVSLDDVQLATDDPVGLIALDTALNGLAVHDPEAARIVELRVFAGLTIEDTAAALDISPQRVSREWTYARTWLKQHMVAAD